MKICQIPLSPIQSSILETKRWLDSINWHISEGEQAIHFLHLCSSIQVESRHFLCPLELPPTSLAYSQNSWLYFGAALPLVTSQESCLDIPVNPRSLRFPLPVETSYFFFGIVKEQAENVCMLMLHDYNHIQGLKLKHSGSIRFCISFIHRGFLNSFVLIIQLLITWQNKKNL